MLRLTVEDIKAMHTRLVMATGGSDGVRDEGLLDSAVNSPFQSFGGVDVYPTIYHKAARLGFSLSQNHSFIDGNKRIAAQSVLTFLALNGLEIDCTEFELFSMFYKLAAHEVTFEELVKWLKSHSS